MSEAIKARLIGGPKDGETIAIQDNLHFLKVISHSLDMGRLFGELTQDEAELPFITHLYQRNQGHGLDENGVEDIAVYLYIGEQ